MHFQWLVPLLKAVFQGLKIVCWIKVYNKVQLSTNINFTELSKWPFQVAQNILAVTNCVHGSHWVKSFNVMCKIHFNIHTESSNYRKQNFNSLKMFVHCVIVFETLTTQIYFVHSKTATFYNEICKTINSLNNVLKLIQTHPKSFFN